MQTTPLQQSAQPCSGTFVAHDLDHITTVPGDTVDQFEANGAGLALGDLDNDGELDIVLANHAGPNTILWNQGGLNFRSQRMPIGNSRAVTLVDVDADGWLDILLTRRTGAINYWHNEERAPSSSAVADLPAEPSAVADLLTEPSAVAGLLTEPSAVAGLLTGPQRHFIQRILPGIARPAYAMNWADLDRDGDLDLVTGSYDASLLVDLGNNFLLGGGAGVYVWENRGGRFMGQRLASTAQAMSIVFFDANADGWLDIVVGNDFAVPDYLWLRSADGWQPSAFDATSYSTMSLDAGDIDNDGSPELFSTDMMPYSEEPAMVAAYEPLMADADHDMEPGDPQIMANVLLVRTGVIGYQDAARPRGVDATGWSWSAKFGDLDQDGLLDLYVVNGMAEATLFAHLPGGELVEENQALRNSGNGYFRPAPEWGLGSTYGGRGMSIGDLDGDGDLDIVVNNLRGPAQLFENRLCGGDSLLVDLRWPESGNTRAIGAQVALHTSVGTLYRDVRAASGYISGDPPRLHFGFPADATLQALEIRWPDGGRSLITEPSPHALLTITRTAPPRPFPTSPAAQALADQRGSEMPARRQPAVTGGEQALDQELWTIIARRGLTGDPSQGRNLPDINDPLAQLGMALFFSKALSGDLNVACASCHHPLLGGGDALSLSIGVGAVDPDLLGPGRSHPSGELTIARNAPTTFNTGLWDQVLFHDGRIESLGKMPGRNGSDGQGIRTPDSLYGEADPEAGPNLPAAQSRFPLTAVDEMRGYTFEAYRPNRYVRAHLAARLGDYGVGRGELKPNTWLKEFQRAFGKADAEVLITDQAIATAIAAYERSQVFVDTPWKAYVQGNTTAISVAAKRGALLFFKGIEEGGAGCARCHSGDFFTDEQFHVLAVPQVGPGKGDGPFHDDDYGRFRESGNPQDLYAFRTPSLLNVAVTGPYGHDGAYVTLEGIIRHHLDPAAAVADYDPAQLGPAVQAEHMAFNTARALAKLEADRRAGRSLLEPVRLSDQQVAELVSFLETLTDPCVLDAACLAPWLPDEADPDPDGLRLRARIERAGRPDLSTE